ncbi:MAG: tetratricopeptide repeat protein [Acidobacteriota bacterium]
MAPGPGAGVVLVLATLLFSGLGCRAQAPPSAPAQASPDRGRILLVLPFDSHSGQPNLEWVREAAADLLTSRFASAGFAPMTRADRVYALDHLGLPPGFQPSRASALKLAQTLDADSIIVGSFSLDGKDIVAEGQVVNIPHLRMTEPVFSRGPMDDMVTVFDTLAWKLTRELDPSFNVDESTFVAAGRNIRIAAYEQYIRGITEPDQAERLRHLQQAVKLSPDFSPAWMALGREQYNAQQYEQAAQAFAKVDRGANALEAGFYRGLSLLYSGNYPDAERAFAAVARTLPLASVVNNQGVAVSRQGHDGTALFVQAAAEDPSNPDYHFNLAVSLKHHGNAAAAANELAQCLKLRPGDSEAQSLLDAWKHPVVLPASTGADPAPDPLERIVRTFDAAAFRQAAQMLDQMDAARMKALAPSERAQKLCAQADDYLDRGLLLEAERLYREAAAGDPGSIEAHVGLARVRQQTGDLAGARKEAQAALALAPSAAAYVILAQLDLAGNHLKEAEGDAQSALRIEPTNVPAAQVLQQILARSRSSQ